jgi:glycosyltransferase involved in cell wall biosynthesis
MLGNSAQHVVGYAFSAFVEYRGFVDQEEKIELLQSCRAMLAPSVWWEPLGLVTYEAYDFGKPMLAAASGGLTETVRDGVTGFLYESANPKALAEVVKRLEDLPSEEVQAMGRKGRSWLLEEFSPAAWKIRFKGIVDSVASNPVERS